MRKSVCAGAALMLGLVTAAAPALAQSSSTQHPAAHPATPAAPPAQGAAPAAPAAVPAGRYSVDDTDLGTLLDDAAARAVIDRVLPGFTANPQLEMARSLTLRTLQQYASETITEQKLTDIQAGLSALPPHN